MKIAELNDEEISDDYELSEVLSEQLTGYCEALEKENGMTRKPTEDDGSEIYTYWSFIWTSVAQVLIEEEMKRLQNIATKYFPDGDVDITSHMYREE